MHIAVSRHLEWVRELLDSGPDENGVAAILDVMGATDFPAAILDGMRLYGDYLPMGVEEPYTEQQRYLHFLWEALDKFPIGSAANFSIPFRRMIAGRLFRKCGRHFIAEENVRFNFGHKIELGDDAFFNRGVFLDTKGGIRIGNSVALAEDVRIFTHSHSESSHSSRTYKEVVIEDFAKIFVGATLLPGVTIGRQAIVSAASLVTRDVPPNTVVAGIPAKVIRERKTEGRSGRDLNHIWLRDGAFQGGSLAAPDEADSATRGCR